MDCVGIETFWKAIGHHLISRWGKGGIWKCELCHKMESDHKNNSCSLPYKQEWLHPV